MILVLAAAVRSLRIAMGGRRKISTTPFSKGLIKAAIYYAVAFFLTWLVYQIVGHTYIHGPGLHHILGFLALAGGAIWMIVGIVRLVLNKQDNQNIGSLIVNIVVVSSIAIYFIIEINKEPVVDSSPNNADIITVNKDSSTNSSSIVNGLGDTLYLKVGDSVYIDKTKELAK
jgi:hypothetical protein